MMSGNFGPPRRHVFNPPEEGGAVVRKAGEVTQLAAAKSFSFGEPIAREEPLLRVPADTQAFLFSLGPEVMKEVAKRLGDTSRLAAFLAFSKLTEKEREQVLALGVCPGCKVAEETSQIMGMFLADFPQFKDGLDWELFSHVVAITTDRGSRLPSGEYVLYGLSGVAAHSLTPNAVIERRGDRGEKELRVIAYAGISADEEVTVNYASEDALFLPKDERLTALRALRNGSLVDRGDVETALELHPILERVRRVQKKDDSKEAAERETELRQLLEDLINVDKGLPFAMAAKARARTNLANAFEECRDAALNPVAIALYEAAAEETEVVLGTSGRTTAENLRRRVKDLEAQSDEI